MEYISVPEARKLPGLRIVLSPGGPGPWSEAAKSICYLKRLSYIPVAQEVGGPNPELYEWTAQTSAPAVIWNDERPRNLWNDQLFLFERLAPEPAMIPARIDERATMFGYAKRNLRREWLCLEPAPAPVSLRAQQSQIEPAGG